MKTSFALSALVLGSLAILIAGCSPAAEPEPAPSPSHVQVSAKTGEELAGEGWAVTVNSAQFDADETVAAANEFNPAAEDGEQYLLVNLTIERTTSPAASPLAIQVKVAAEDDTFHEAAAVAPEQLRLLEPVSPGTPITGNLAYLIPATAAQADVQIHMIGSGSTFVVPIT